MSIVDIRSDTVEQEEGIPNLGKPREALGECLQRAWPTVKKHPKSHLAVAGISTLLTSIAAVLIGGFVITAKNATIEMLKMKINLQKDTSADITRLTQDNAQLRRELLSSTLPLKSKTEVLANQLAEFFRQERTNNQWYLPFAERFEHRLWGIQTELDQAGYYSKELETAVKTLNVPEAYAVTNLPRVIQALRAQAKAMEKP